MFKHSSRRFWGHAATIVALLVLAVQVEARNREECTKDFQPQTGQSGKDVIWVPTGDELVVRMLQMAKVTPKDKVYDLGAGDGKIAITAAKRFGANAVGVEFNPDMVRLAQCYAEADGVSQKVKIVQGDIFQTDFSDATVVTLYLLPELNLRLRPTLLNMKPGTRVVSHSFMMDDWKPDQESVTNDGAAYLWIVPAKVAGTWTFREQGGNDNFTVRLDQNFQEVRGSTGDGGEVTTAKVNGPQIELAFTEKGRPTKISGSVDGDRIVAKVTRNGKTSNYVGSRA